MQKAAQEVVKHPKYVKGGPQLWVAQTLYKKGNISTNMLWDEYTRDTEVKINLTGQPETDLIKSKNFLKERVLATMLAQGKIERTRASDILQFKNSGWKLVQHKAFEHADPSLLAEMKPLP